ncbi:hypothetical protein MKW98_001588 [Papaver atlanticum]|uniref:Uncharacterized protein n=1 Tax=Papaver atlanticum TaxID=357466 RepID=A0AAD4S7V8_9MAGN|nr:hypothetical protein MKW98_001588 [Papaver atlanticum]
MQRNQLQHHLCLSKCRHQTDIMGGSASVSISHNDHQCPANNKPAAPLPHNYECIIQDADMNINQSELHPVQKYWIDNSGYNCFMLFPRDLAISWAENNKYWHWSSMKESSASCEMAIEVAELLNVCWLEVNGKLDISKLNPGVKYEIVFVVMLKNSAYGWEAPVNLRLPKSQWIEVQVGEFQAPPQLADDKQRKEIQFSLFECENGNWKGGLVIKGVIVRPKK